MVGEPSLSQESASMLEFQPYSFLEKSCLTFVIMKEYAPS